MTLKLWPAAVLALSLDASAAIAPGFTTAVQPVLRQNCVACHNEKLTSGNLNLNAFLDPASIASNREGWERILAKLRSGEMPPKGLPRPPAGQLTALASVVQTEFDRADRLAKPDPGRVTARRLNRAEYANTIRDLLGVHFVAQEEFPADDSGYGFDNIGDVLTVSPALMEKYIFAAERIASRAVGADPLPKPGVFSEKSRMLRSGPAIAQCTDHVEYDAEYIFRVILAGHRRAEDKPVTVVLSVDGKPLKTVTVDVKISDVNRQGGATERKNQEVRTYLTEGPHTFRVAIVNDDALKDIPKEVRLNPNRNIFPESIEIAGPFPPSQAALADIATSRRKSFLFCDPAAGSSCVDRIMSALAHRAYRRPVSKAEVADLVHVSEKAGAAGYTPGQSLQFAIEAMLCSPQFLFRVEHDPKTGAPGRISDLELATRLSYFLWSSMPDEELLHLGESSKLRNPVVLDAQLKRMLADPKSAALAENFAGQWLEIRSLDAVKPDKAKFPEWGPELKEAMRTETRMFFEEVVRENRPVSDFIDGKYTFLNETLARHYGIDGVTGPEFRRVELATDQRSGVLTQASVLTVSSYPSRTSPVLRGKYMLENILGAPPPPPPADVPALDEAVAGNTKSLRQTMEQHRSNPVCASCHSRMDVLGFGLENYNAVGQWRTQDGKFPVDASGTFPNGKTFVTPAEMKALLRSNLPDFTRCLTEKMLTYALGRGVEKFDGVAIRQIVRQSSAGDYRFQTLISSIVHSVPFQMRRAESTKPTQELVSK
jgi:mono/diheme cytochrome c family protein